MHLKRTLGGGQSLKAEQRATCLLPALEMKRSALSTVLSTQHGQYIAALTKVLWIRSDLPSATAGVDAHIGQRRHHAGRSA